MSDTKEIKRAVEALLFVADTPLSSAKLASIIGCSPKLIENTVEILKNEYSKSDRAFTIKMVSKGYRLYTLSEFSHLIKNLKGKRELYLSNAALTALAVIVYRQPITRKELENIRGVDCSGVINTLQEANLIKIVGKGEGFGHPYLYGTTERFLEVFHLKNLGELPEITSEDSAFFGESGSNIKKESY